MIDEQIKQVVNAQFEAFRESAKNIVELCEMTSTKENLKENVRNALRYVEICAFEILDNKKDK